MTGGLTVNSDGAKITGGLTVFGTIAEVSTSDRRLKSDISIIDNALHKVGRLNGIYFKWVKDVPEGLSYDSNRHVGIVAQEVQQVLPEIVHAKHGGKYLGVDYVSLIPLLIEAIHELEEMNTGLHEEIEEMKEAKSDVQAQLDLMKSQIAALESILFA